MITALAEREQLPLGGLAVKADGVVGRRPDGHFGFVRTEQTVDLTTDAGHEDAARALVPKAKFGHRPSTSPPAWVGYQT
jgi:hypothetical protein